MKCITLVMVVVMMIALRFYSDSFLLLSTFACTIDIVSGGASHL
jgi:hypothetical protein